MMYNRTSLKRWPTQGKSRVWETAPYPPSRREEGSSRKLYCVGTSAYFLRLLTRAGFLQGIERKSQDFASRLFSLGVLSMCLEPLGVLRVLRGTLLSRSRLGSGGALLGGSLLSSRSTLLGGALLVPSTPLG